MVILFRIFSYLSLRDVDQEVTDLLKLCKHVHEINACKIIVAVALDIDDMLLTKVISALVDVVLGVLGIRDFL